MSVVDRNFEQKRIKEKQRESKAMMVTAQEYRQKRIIETQMYLKTMKSLFSNDCFSYILTD